MFEVFFIFVYPVIFLGANGQDFTCSTSWGSSCPSVTPLVSGPTCPEGFDQVEKYCFKVSDDHVYWNESKDLCEEMNAKLAEPRELVINSTVFANYLWQQMDDSEYDDYYYEYGYKDQTFSLGGQFKNDSWNWLTGGNISTYIAHWDGDCLGINIYSDGEYGPRSVENEEFGFYLRGIPCSSERVPSRDNYYVYGTYRYVCQAAMENNSYSACETTENEYASGQLVSMDTQQCQQNWCQNGSIQHYTCGNITTGCCEYRGILYGDGDFIGPEVPTEDCSGCHQLVCLAGDILWQACTNCSVHCCFFNGASYQPGSHIQNVCARLVCNGDTGDFNHLGIDYNCPKCKAYLDPHIVTYDQKWSSYSYQGCGNYSLSQIGSSYQPTLAIYATFVPCGGSWDVTCVDTVTFKNDEHTIITIGYNDNEIQIQVNGEDYAVPSFYPSIVQVMSTVYPVLVWKDNYCVTLQGSSGILVRFCGSSWSNQAYVWTDTDIAGGLRGLCGTVNDDVDDDFIARDGTIVSTWQRDPPVEFPLSWLASVASNGNCDNGTVRVKRQVQNRCEADPSLLDTFNWQCLNTALSVFSDPEPEELQTIIDDCVFDLCNVNDPDEWLSAVQETAKVQAEIQQHTLNFTTPTTTTSAPITTTPNPTIDCNCTSKCWKKSGYCTTDPESCDGRVKHRGCDGPGCVCCIPKGCRPKRKCRRKGGFCTSGICSGGEVATNGCRGRDCVCCLQPGRCKPKKKCWKKGGLCLPKHSTCTGRIIKNGCKSGNCYCCVNEPIC